jgi:hypothetical protein
MNSCSIKRIVFAYKIFHYYEIEMKKRENNFSSYDI